MKRLLSTVRRRSPSTRWYFRWFKVDWWWSVTINIKFQYELQSFLASPVSRPVSSLANGYFCPKLSLHHSDTRASTTANTMIHTQSTVPITNLAPLRRVIKYSFEWQLLRDNKVVHPSAWEGFRHGFELVVCSTYRALPIVGLHCFVSICGKKVFLFKSKRTVTLSWECCSKNLHTKVLRVQMAMRYLLSIK